MSALRGLAFALLLALAACGGGGGIANDGGVSGTGISAVTGNVVEITGAGGEIAGIAVRVAGTDVVGETDVDGSFSLSGEFDGAVTLVFARPADGLSVQVDVQVPAGGALALDDIVLDGPSGEARPARRSVRIRGRIDDVDCPAARLFVVSPVASAPFVFTVRLDRTLLRDEADRPLRCEDLRPGLEVAVSGTVQDDASIADGEVVVSPVPEPTPTRTRNPATPTPGETPRETPRPRPSATDEDGVPTRPTVTDLPTRPTASPTDPPGRPSARATTTATRLPPSPTPTRVRPSPTPTRSRT